MKRKAIFMGLIVLMCTGNQVHASVQPAVTGIFNASWSTLAKQGAMVAAGVAVLGGLAYYLLSLKKKQRTFDPVLFFGKDHPVGSNSIEYCKVDGKCYRHQVVNRVATTKEITEKELNQELKKTEASIQAFSAKMDGDMAVSRARMDNFFDRFPSF